MKKKKSKPLLDWQCNLYSKAKMVEIPREWYITIMDFSKRASIFYMKLECEDSLMHKSQSRIGVKLDIVLWVTFQNIIFYHFFDLEHVLLDWFRFGESLRSQTIKLVDWCMSFGLCYISPVRWAAGLNRMAMIKPY